MTDLTNEMVELVKMSLPAIHAASLQEFITRAKTNEAALDALKEREKRMQETIDCLEALERTVASNQMERTALDGLAKTLNARETKLDVQDVRLVMEREKVALVKEMFGLVFRNTEIRRTMTGSVPIKDSSGYITSSPSNQEVTETEG